MFLNKNSAHTNTWQLTISQFVFVVTLLNLILYHSPLTRYVTDNLDYASLNGMLTVFVLGLVIVFVTSIILFILAFISPKLLKIFSILMVLVNSAAVYFVNTYQVSLDKTMMGNIFNTRSVESLSYLHPKLFLYIFILGIIPAWILYKIPLKKVKRLSIIKHSLFIFVISLGLIYANGSKWLWLDRHATRLGGIIMPWSYVINAIRYQSGQLKPVKQQLLPPATFNNNDKTLVILVIGESARAKNFSLYGYERLTNPLLAQTGVIALENSQSCSTYTTASVKCILSSLGSDSDTLEPLPSYLFRHGVDVIWRTKNWGEPPIKVTDYQHAKDLKNSCEDDECNHDGVLLSGLSDRIQTSKSNKIFVVLHMTGSHGPSYYEKYPPRFEIFKPVCKSVELSQCTSQELINAYDNTILYTDYFLNNVINLLQESQTKNTLMIYVSDHGESLGEYGIYLHGTPKALAPDVQKDIPYLLWLSQSLKEKKGLLKTPYQQRDEHSQKNVFHTVLGAFDLSSKVYQQQFDLLRARQ